MALLARLRAFGFPGYLTRPPFVADVHATLLDRAHRKKQLLNGLTVLGPRKSKGGEQDFDPKAPLILNSANSSPDVQNTEGAWSGDATYKKRAQGVFGRQTYVLSHERNLPNTSALYTSTFQVGRNGCIALRLFVHKAHENIPFGVVGLRFGQWLLQHTGDGLELALLKPTWTQAIENDINALRGVKGYDAQIDAARAEHYELFESLPSGESFDGGKFYDITIIPESRGALNVIVGDDFKRVVVPELAQKRKGDQTLYDATALTIFGNGPSFIWQSGYPVFAPTGDFVFPFKFYATPGDGVNEFAEVTKNAVTDEPIGTSVVIEIKDEGSRGEIEVGVPSPEHIYSLYLTATTTDTRITPFIYSAQVIQPANPRQGFAFDDESYDSDDDDFKISLGGVKKSLISEVTMTCEAENWARQYQVVFADPDGKALPKRRLYEALEGRHVGLIVGGAQVLSGNGLVMGAERSNMSSAEYNFVTGDQFASGASQAVLNIADGWGLLEDSTLPCDLILDGLRLGAAIRLLLRNAGWADFEMTGVSANFGIKLPPAAVDEEPCIVAKGGQSYASVCRDLMDKWSMGARLWHHFNGAWTISPKSNAVVRAFERDATIDSRLRYYGPLDYSRDFSECYNHFTVVGFTNARGETLSRTWREAGGVRYGSNAQQQFVGRPRIYPTVHDEGVRTLDHALWMLRSLKERYGSPGRFISTQIHWWQDLLPGMVVTLGRHAETLPSIHPLKCRVHRIGGASAKEDRMTVVFQEMVQRYGLGA